MGHLGFSSSVDQINLQAAIQEEKQQFIQEHLVMKHKLNEELVFLVQKDNTEQKLNNNVVYPGDDKVKRREFGSWEIEFEPIILVSNKHM